MVVLLAWNCVKCYIINVTGGFALQAGPHLICVYFYILKCYINIKAGRLTIIIITPLFCPHKWFSKWLFIKVPSKPLFSASIKNKTQGEGESLSVLNVLYLPTEPSLSE